MAAMDAVGTAIVPEQKNPCQRLLSGGTMLAIAAGYLARDGDDRLASNSPDGGADSFWSRRELLLVSWMKGQVAFLGI